MTDAEVETAATVTTFAGKPITGKTTRTVRLQSIPGDKRTLLKRTSLEKGRGGLREPASPGGGGGG